jgi:hypothetical protein
MCERGITQSCTGRLVWYYFVRTLIISNEHRYFSVPKVVLNYMLHDVTMRLRIFELS